MCDSQGKVFVTKTDVRNVSCCDLLESLFCSTGNPLAPLLLNIFVYCSLYLIFIKTWMLTCSVLPMSWPGEPDLHRREVEHHLEASGQLPTGRQKVRQGVLQRRFFTSASPPFCLHPDEPRLCLKIWE